MLTGRRLAYRNDDILAQEIVSLLLGARKRQRTPTKYLDAAKEVALAIGVSCETVHVELMIPIWRSSILQKRGHVI
jgi:hypothetical protein